MQVKPFPVILKEAYMLSPKVKHFVFESSLNPVFDYLPGQFITIHFEKEGKILRRSYSIANVPQQNNLIEFAAGYVEGGPGTQLLFNLKPGDAINITGPFGRLILKDNAPKRYLLVATSTGVTPYRAMLSSLKEHLLKNPDSKVVILQGVQKSEDVLYKNEFSAFAKEFSTQVVFRAHLSREPKENLKEFEFSGYVQTAFPELQLNPAEDLIYLCGNPSMIDEAFAYLKEQNFEMPQIIREKYISR
ncbi:ferredoxin--NADP reductase [Legionella adelaidensis]|nr:ferredoxin--NADP reductase [Legionella adelaidensis]